MSSIFGSPSQSQSSTQSASGSQSSNQAYPYLQSAYGGQVGNGTTANNALASLLGVGGNPAAQQQAFQNFQNSTGYQFGLNQGTQAITQNAAAQGLLNSGSTAKALNTYGQNYANTQYQNYLNPLQSLISSGTTAGGLIGNTGQQSSSASNSVSLGNSTGAKQGALGGLGSLIGGIASGY